MRTRTITYLELGDEGYCDWVESPDELLEPLFDHPNVMMERTEEETRAKEEYEDAVREDEERLIAIDKRREEEHRKRMDGWQGTLLGVGCTVFWLSVIAVIMMAVVRGCQEVCR